MNANRLQVLGDAMSAISERCFYAGWLGGTEYFVPELCRRAIESNEPQPWGHGHVSTDEANELTSVVHEIGYWADLNDSATGYVQFDPFPIPKKYIDSLDRELKSRE